MDEVLILPTEVKDRFLDLKSDHGFKKVLGSEKNKLLTIGFTNDVLGKKGADKITNLNFLPTIQEPENASQKQIIHDVTCIDPKGNQYILFEMQQKSVDYLRERLLFYVTRTYAHQLKKGQEYSSLKGVTLIAIVDFIFDDTLEGYITHHQMQEERSHRLCFPGLKIVVVELPKFRMRFKKMQKKIEELTPADSWFYCMEYANSATEEELERMKKHYPEMMPEMLDTMVWTPEDIAIHQEIRAEMRRLDELQREKELLARGKAKVINMLFNGGMNLDDVIKTTGMPPEEIEDLRSKYNN